MRGPLIALATLGSALLALAACGGDGGGSSGRIAVDGSSTVAPFANAAAERFRRDGGAQVVVGVSGTGGGFERFCRGETDLSNASRPIKEEEIEVCRANGVEYTELQLANDAISVAVNNGNDWAGCLTTEELAAIWKPGSEVDSWDDVRAGFPEQRLKLYGPGTDSGTFDYFTSEIVGEEGASRSDYTPSENDNVLVQGVAGDGGALGYFGFSYLVENQGKIKGVAIDTGNGCVEPSIDAAQAGDYTPLSRPLLVYATERALERREVQDFLRFMLENNDAIAESARAIPLTDAQVDEQLAKLGDA